MHLTHREVRDKLLSYSEGLQVHYELYQLLLFHFQEKNADHFFGLIEQELPTVHPLFQTVFWTFLRDRDKIINALKLPYSNAKLEATNNLIKVIKRKAFGFRNFNNFKKTDFDDFEHQKREYEFRTLQIVAFRLPTTLDKEPPFIPWYQRQDLVWH